jgi:hypothetical protein
MTEILEFDSQLSKKLLILRIIQTGFGAHPASYLVDIGHIFSRGLQRQEGEANRSPATSVEIEKTWVYISMLLHRAIFN